MTYEKRKDLVIRMFNRCRASVTELAAEADLGYQLTRKILTGQTQNPKSDDIDALYHVLKKREQGNG